MQGQAARLAAAVVFTASVSFSMLPPAGAAPIANCVTEAGPAGPKGSRWHYRLEWPSQRKCWHLVLKGAPARVAAKKSAPQAEPAQGDVDDEVETASTASPSVPPARGADLETKPAVAPPPPALAAPKVKTLITRNASNAEDAQAWPEPPANAAAPAPGPDQAAAPVPQPSANTAPPAVAAPVASSPVTASETAQAADQGSGPTWRVLLAALALMGFAGAAICIGLEVMRRRTDVLNRELEAGELPAHADPEHAYDAQPEEFHEEDLVEPEPTYAPLPPISLQQRDDVDDAIRRLLNTRRHAA